MNVPMPSRARNGWKIHIYQVSIVRVKVRDLRKSSAYSSADIFRPNRLRNKQKDLLFQYPIPLYTYF